MTHKISINNIFETSMFEIVPSTVRRDWMDASDGKFAYHCVPLNVANTYGWTVLCPEDFTVSWNGKSDLDAITVNDGLGSDWVLSHFGGGVFTISVDFVVRTDPGVSLYVRGTPNEPSSGAVPLDAIVETDWLPFTFTFNYIFTEPCTVEFEKGTPLFSFFPIERSFIKDFDIERVSIQEDKDFYEKYLEYSSSRKSYLDTGENGRQRFYLKGTGADNEKFDILDHTRRYNLKDVE